METIQKRLSLFPITTQVKAGQITIGGLSLEALAQKYGTPLYIFDQATLDDALEQYRRAMAEYYPGPSGLTYAGKSFLNLAAAGWAARQGLVVDCTGAGEISVAVAAGVPRAQILVHGVNKNTADLGAALQYAGTIVVDNPAELERIFDLASDLPAGARPNLWLRLRPGLAVQTHSYTQTGQEDSKFGMSPLEWMAAAERCRALGWPLTGLHFHQGSHFHDPAPLGPAIDTALELLVELRTRLRWTPATLCPGGGWGVPYHEDDLPHQPVESYVAFAARRLAQACQENNLPLPSLHFEPGRSLVARAGVAIYRLEAVKHSAARRWLLLDGGMADNPRPALYGARYTALPVRCPDRPFAGSAWLGGPFCESGDILIHDLPMPEMQPGELVSVPVSGAYHLSMGSNYNGARKPAVLWLVDGKEHLIQRRETIKDLIRRDLPLP